jgi:Txe/YoeB family toxin of Txe-Axe toxin-antitoxin module
MENNMVKKIRVLDEIEEEVLDDKEVQKIILELAKSMDWKVWEILQTLQRLDKKLSVTYSQEED